MKLWQVLCEMPLLSCCSIFKISRNRQTERNGDQGLILELTDGFKNKKIDSSHFKELSKLIFGQNCVCLTKKIAIVEWKPLNVITLGQR